MKIKFYKMFFNRRIYKIKYLATLFILCNLHTSVSQSISFVQKIGENNPLYGGVVDGNSNHNTIDIDADGDFDLFIGTITGDIRFYKNIGTLENPNIFEEQTGLLNPFDALNIGSKVSVSFVDINGDETMDAFVISENSLLFYKNIGTLETAEFELQSTEQTPLSSLDLSNNVFQTLSFSDIDGDNDQDILVGWIAADAQNSSGIDVYENIGSSSQANFTKMSAELNPFKDFNKLYPAPIFVDIDADDDEDVFITTGDGTYLYFENTSQKEDLLVDKKKKSPFLFYPNPAKDKITFSFESEYLTVRMFSLSGQQVLRKKLYKENPFLDVKKFKQGVYLLTLTDENNIKLTKKLVITEY